MKTNNIARLLTITLLFFSVGSYLFAQENEKEKNVSTKISYTVDFGPVYPIEGESYQVVGKAGLNDTTGELERVNFDVPLISFTGIHPGYLAWIGNSWYYPDMEFKSNSITKMDQTHYEVNGTLEFRRTFRPLQIDLTRRDTENEIVLDGEFRLNTRDYFIVPPPVYLVPVWIPFKVTLVFDKPDQNNGKLISFH